MLLAMSIWNEVCLLLLQTTEAAALQAEASTISGISGSSGFLTTYSTQTNDFITAVNNLPPTAPGAGDSTVTTLREWRPLHTTSSD